jgi:uncharacterized protein
MLFVWLILVYILLIIPIFELIAYYKYKKQIMEQTFSKQSFYYSTYLELWLPIFGILILLFVGILRTDDLFLTKFIYNIYSINIILVIIINLVILLPIMLVILQFYQYIGIKKSEVFRKAYYEAVKNKNKSEDEYTQLTNAILPSNQKENIQFILVSITAGITEEILFRAFFVYCMNLLLPNIPIPILLIIQAIPFGLMHLYQGIKGVLITTLMGLLFGLYVIIFGSIIPGIIIHILVDLSSNLIEKEQKQTS